VAAEPTETAWNVATTVFNALCVCIINNFLNKISLHFFKQNYITGEIKLLGARK
jgi:hypothetical protein